jgi:glycerol-3-phosphate dehydrogenase
VTDFQPGSLGEFSYRTRAKALQRFGDEIFDLLIIGGGITGAAVARDASSRGLKVALVERRDFAWGTSSRSSKLIHGGLRYLENMEFALVFEALAERALLLKTVPHLVRPLKFFFPVYKGDAHGKGILGLGMWLYDLLAAFRTPGIHRNLSRDQLLKEIPFLESQDLVGGFSYYDASMWDDVLAVQILRSAQHMGAAIANYVEALTPIYGEPGAAGRVSGFIVRDREKPEGQGEIHLRAHQVVVCAGPWTDLVGKQVSGKWHPWLMPSKGVHLVFDQKRIPVTGAMVMSHPQDGRIVFVIPRPDYGAGVTIVGTTDGPSPAKPEDVGIDTADVHYLMKLLEKYFPELQLTTQDIVSAYVGIRPLMAPHVPSQVDHDGHMKGKDTAASSGDVEPALQKVSREHHIGEGPGGTVVVAGGKYTTHRNMARQIVDFALKTWKRDHREGKIQAPVPKHSRSKTKKPVNPLATPEKIAETFERIPERELVERYGAEAADILELARESLRSSSLAENSDLRSGPGGAELSLSSPLGFPDLEAQLRQTIRTEMVMHLEDFYLRRVPLYLARADHGLPWAKELARVWAEERGLKEADAARELEQLEAELERRSRWKKGLIS